MVKYFFKRAAMLMALAAVVIASGCKQTVNTETVNTGTTAVAVTGIKLNKGDLSLKVDESKKLAATVMPANATNKQVTWASDKPAVATVSQDGTVTAKEEGTAQITVKTVNGGKIARCKITVTAKDPTPPAEFTVEVTHVGHGTISANPAIPASRKIAKDTSITFTAKADTGFSVDTWTITGGEILDGTGTEGSLTAKVKITANTTVKVSFKKISYKVTFDAKGGLPVPTEQHVLYKEKASAPTVPAKEGYDFEDWFNKDGDAPWDFTVNEVTKDTELYAKWKAKKYTVNFNVDGGDGNLTATLNGSSFTGGEVEHGNTVEFRAKPKEGYKVDKWSITPGSALIDGGTDGSKTAKVKITAPTTVTVSFKKISYKVIFDAKGGLPVPTAQHVLYKEKASAPTVPAKEGYDFEDWFNKDGDAPWDFTVNEVTKDTELYAKWKAKKYTVNFNVDGGNGTLKAKLDGKPFTGGDINFGKTVIFTAEPDEGYAVEQWTLNGTEAPASAVSTTYQCSVTAETEVRVRFIRKKEVGLIVLSNGLFKRRDNYTTIDPQNPPVAVIAGKLNGNIFGIALRTSGREFSWAESGSTGNDTNFEGIVCTPSNDDAQTATFTDDTDGSDNWKYICSIDPNGTVNAAENYPAFYWVNTYNETYKTKLGGKTFAWYMPSVAELCEVYKNRGAIAESLKKINRLDSHYAETSISFDTSLYWSSSQKAYVNKSAWRVNFYGGSMSYNSKRNKTRVCCIAVF